jgi:hypothetical protein
MGLLINDELIWLSIPRCASVSIEIALLNSNLNVKKLKIDEKYAHVHMHFKKSELFEEFGIHKTVCIKRNWFERWISGLQQLFYRLDSTKTYNPIIKWEDIDNNFIYNTFDTDFSNALYAQDTENWDRALLRLIKESTLLERDYDSNGNIIPSVIGNLSVLLSQNHIKDNKPADYEFDISEIDKFSNFIYDRFGETIEIKKINKSKPIPNKIVIDDKLKQWVWDKFENRFEKRNQLI